MSPVSPQIHASYTTVREPARYRILIVDDNPAIHSDFKKILSPPRPADSRADDLESLLFGAPAKASQEVIFELDFAFQGQEALRMVNDSIAEGRPYAMAFIDVRMPPGWDGVETVNHLWAIHPGLQAVICTAYSDYSLDKMRSMLTQPDSLVFLKKPFDNVEVQQLAHTLCRKWELNLQAVLGIQQLDKNIRKLLVPAAGTDATDIAVHDPDIEEHMMASQDGVHFVTSLIRLNGAVDSTRRQLRHAEQHLVQSEKMASLGRLSAGIIHEINNPLNYAMAALSMLESSAKDLPLEVQADHIEALADMRDGFSRVIEITSSLRKFAHPDKANPVQVSVSDSVRTALRLMSAELKGGIVVENNITEDVIVWATGSKLAQVLINLVHNAAHALRSKPFAAGTSPRISFDAISENGRTTISVTDNGTGIPDAEQDKVFDPFYTTKDVGQGTGLGLGICHQIVTQFNATISVESVEGEFTRFNLSFPHLDF